MIKVHHLLIIQFNHSLISHQLKSLSQRNSVVTTVPLLVILDQASIAPLSHYHHRDNHQRNSRWLDLRYHFYAMIGCLSCCCYLINTRIDHH